MNYFDFHCHLDADQLNGTREQLLHDMKDQEVGACTIGVDLDSSKRAVALSTACENVWCCVGQHPLDNKTQQFKASTYQKLIDEHPNQVVGIGECGLDYYWPVKDLNKGKIDTDEFETEKKRQKLLFIQNIQLAIANNLPLMLHVRSSEGNDDAHQDTLAILEEYPECRSKATTSRIKVVFHFYTEGPDLAQQIINAGYYISLPGVITFADCDEMVKTIPLDKIFAETDSPYAAPKPHRGKTNNPLYVEHVYMKIAELKELPVDDVRKQILQNVEEFFGIGRID